MKWQPIETAPKDRDIHLQWAPVEEMPPAMATGKWDRGNWAYIDPFDGWWVHCTGASQPTLWAEQNHEGT